MSLPLKDFRCPIPEATDVWFESEAQAFGVDKQVIARQVLNEWARKKFHAYKVAQRRLAANGLQVEFDGLDTEDDGAARTGRR